MTTNGLKRFKVTVTETDEDGGQIVNSYIDYAEDSMTMAADAADVSAVGAKIDVEPAEIGEDDE